MSKVTLPWRQKVRKSTKPARRAKRNFWEPFAVIVSLVTAMIALYQTIILQEQLTLPDRTRTIQAAIEKAQQVCDIFHDIPFTQRTMKKLYSPPKDGTVEAESWGVWEPIPDKPYDQVFVDDMGSRAAAASRQFANSLAQTQIWKETRIVGAYWAHVFPSWFVEAGEFAGYVKDNDFDRHAFAMRLVVMECDRMTKRLTNVLTRSEVYTGLPRSFRRFRVEIITDQEPPAKGPDYDAELR